MEHRNISRLTLTLIGLLGPSAYGHQEESHEHGNLEHCVNFETEETTVHNGHLGAARFTIKNNTCSIGAYITWCWETSGRNGYRFRCDSIARADRRKLTRPDIRRTEARYVLESGGNMEAGPEDTKPDGTAYWFAACAAERQTAEEMRHATAHCGLTTTGEYGAAIIHGLGKYRRTVVPSVD